MAKKAEKKSPKEVLGRFRVKKYLEFDNFCYGFSKYFEIFQFLQKQIYVSRIYLLGVLIICDWS